MMEYPAYTAAPPSPPAMGPPNPNTNPSHFGLDKHAQPLPVRMPRTKPPPPPRGWTGRAAAYPMVAYGLCLLAIALTFAMIATLTRCWITHDRATDFFPRSSLPLGFATSSTSNTTLTTPAAVQLAGLEREMYVGLWVSCFEVGNAGDCIRTLDLAEGSFRRTTDDDGDVDGFGSGLETSIRAVQALMIVGVVLLLLAMLVCLATLASGKNWKNFRILRFAAACLVLMAILALGIAWLVWLVSTGRTYSQNGNSLKLFCTGCNLGYSFWFVLVAIFLGALAVCLLLCAGEPPKTLYPTNPYYNSPRSPRSPPALYPPRSPVAASPLPLVNPLPPITLGFEPIVQSPPGTPTLTFADPIFLDGTAGGPPLSPSSPTILF